MSSRQLAVFALAMVFVLSAAVAWAGGSEQLLRSSDTVNGPTMSSVETQGARLETLWIFDADYEDLVGDNAGWTTYDRSGTLGSENYWHHDTIRMTGFSHLGDSTWWCGTASPCWRQARGYGNDWTQILERQFDEAVGLDGILLLEYDQRYAMEKDYDYGYVDVRSAATSDTWYTVVMVTNPGFAGTPGRSQDWDSTEPSGPGHVIANISEQAMGIEFDLRFRMESDGAYSSQDQWNNPTTNPCLDGAWQIDNIVLKDDGASIWMDDAESGDPWTHNDTYATGQTGVSFWRGRFGIDFITGRDFTCDDRPYGSWMYAPVDPFTSKMVDNQWSWLMSPPIDISGAQKLVGSWDYWLDMPGNSEDLYNVYLASDDNQECVTNPDGFVDEEPGWWYGGPYWNVKYDDWDAFAGNDWLAVLHAVRNDYEEDAGPHLSGYWVTRTRVGIPSGDAGTQFNIDIWNNFNDWFQEQLVDALLDTAQVTIADDDDVTSAYLVASSDGGATWESYSARRENPESNLWYFQPPASLMVPGSEIRYYYEAVDGVGNVGTRPDDAPKRFYEMSILPLEATVSDPGLLLVDKHRRLTPGENRDYDHTSQYYYREMLGILGYDWETYEVEVESGSTDQANGPDSAGYKYYDTQIWFTNRFDSRTITPLDQAYIIDWLQQSGEGKERNLVMAGNNWGTELMTTGVETLSFYETWLASSYLDNSVGSVVVDSVPGLEDHAGDYDFMTHDDGQCIVRGGCPFLHNFDVLEPYAGIGGNETVADYVKQDAERRPAGVAYTHQTLGYQTVNLGFGIEFMMDSMLPGGYYETGVWDRSNLMGNILDYFGQTPNGPGTGVPGGVRNKLSHAYPNPFNPVTRIAYSVKEGGPVLIEVYNVAGRVVRTLLDTEADAGASGYVVWDGMNDGGEKCASGVYFYRIAAPGFTESHKMIILK